MERNPYMVRDCLIALRSGFLKYETDGIFLHAQDVRELNAYLRRLAGYNHILGHELMRCRWQLKAGYDPLSGVVLPFRRFQKTQEEFCDE
ncbi:hypothetical protein [Bartonella krasnovii]|uniref:Uncharacterized protein n=1 Tax=Bartonella krasnovii TaxID=2267275 RepID=A0A5B9D0Q4_9HYPH|nr:hypothetical protein [Bartonella krasnovii]QEE12096.1 hypothetical protein D1092_03575 [Bartonella krasnovii]UNF36520.1 hypothetical protein MNL11_05225 [Bartonella krasnovii]UNF38376.1 hypothetical protein MNL10_06410 [Bartonella krasnovii]UNF39038.1 hypothetical protein MNL10_00850 [Bartonella krasnovii]UNF39929.1 hypothetical protein MNL09_05455 [Bartonella krasnovii]